MGSVQTRMYRKLTGIFLSLSPRMDTHFLKTGRINVCNMQAKLCAGSGRPAPRATFQLALLMYG